MEDPPEGCENELKPVKLEPNLELEEPRRKTRSCNACGKLRKDLGRHLESHGYDNCLECLLHFPDKKSLDDHLVFVHQVSPECHHCGVCDVSFSSVGILAIHNAKHTGRFECPLCNFVVKGRYSLINHIKRHEGKFRVSCDLCGQGFFSKTSLSSHLEMHEGIPKYQCEYCKKRFTVKRYLDVHKGYNHKKELYGVEEKFQCEVCGRPFSFEKSLVRHLSVIHKVGEDRTVDCPVCKKRIANNHNLKKHMRTHTGEKRFCCDLCGKVFSEKKYLLKHQVIHEREKEHKHQRLELMQKSECFDDDDVVLVEWDEEDDIILF